MIATDNDKQTLINFLNKPLNRQYFDAFFKLCYQKTISRLGCLKQKGHRIPSEPDAINNALSKLTMDILGSFLRSDTNKPYVVIFNHFNKLKITDYSQTDSEEIFNQFKLLLSGYTHQELSRIKKETDPQLDHLKRRIKDIIKQPEFATFNEESYHIEYVCLAGDKTENLNNHPLIPYDELLNLVEEAYYISKNRNEWCRNVFKILDKTPEVQNRLKKHELISAMININIKYVEADGLRPSRLPDADYQLYKNDIEDAKKQSLLWLESEILQRFIQKGNITKEESQRFILAADIYLTDMIYSGVDLLPVYFREVMPESKHSRYLKDYKYIFETSLYKTEEKFKNRIKNSIKLNCSNYYRNRE